MSEWLTHDPKNLAALEAVDETLAYCVMAYF